MQIAICDDTEQDIARIKEVIEKYAADRNLEWKIDTFYTAEDLLDEKEIYDIYILDIYMNKLTGMEAARQIRNRAGNRVEIIFITLSREFALQAFEVYAAQYLLKPVDSAMLVQTIDRIREKQITKPKLYFLVKTAEGIRQLD